jgi:hypothetical protein
MIVSYPEQHRKNFYDAPAMQHERKFSHEFNDTPVARFFQSFQANSTKKSSNFNKIRPLLNF